MDDNDPRDAIARLEAQIEALNESIARCRKVAVMARLVLAAGAIWIVLIVLQAVPFAPFNVVGAIAATLGGIVLSGSNSSTWKQTAAALAAAQAQRTDLIGRIDLRTVEEDNSGDGLVRLADFRRGPTIH